jgi:hypothetical protein
LFATWQACERHRTPSYRTCTPEWLSACIFWRGLQTTRDSDLDGSLSNVSIFPIRLNIIVQIFIIQYSINVAVCLGFLRSIFMTNVCIMSCTSKQHKLRLFLAHTANLCGLVCPSFYTRTGDIFCFCTEEQSWPCLCYQRIGRQKCARRVGWWGRYVTC